LVNWSAAVWDGTEIWPGTIPLLDYEPRLDAEAAVPYEYFGEDEHGPEICGGYVEMPLDLTSATLGQHELSLPVDPGDTFADLVRDNNTVVRPVTVREPGGTLTLNAVDRDTGQGVKRAQVWMLATMWERVTTTVCCRSSISRGASTVRRPCSRRGATASSRRLGPAGRAVYYWYNRGCSGQR